MDEKGKMCSVLIELNEEEHALLVWADDGLKNIIYGVAGVVEVFSESPRYSVLVDHRYDLDFVAKEIEAAIKIIEE